jgi:preprotein translocase subunit SecY
MISIIHFFPTALWNEFLLSENFFVFLLEIGIWVVITGFIVLVTQGTRRIPVQYAKRVVGRKVYGGSTQYLPLRVNAAGVMPIIFAQSIMFIPGTFAAFAPESAFWQNIGAWFGDISGFGYSFVFFFICVFFTYFYTAIAVNPKEMADTMKRQGGFIPGIRPGKQTETFLKKVVYRLTGFGSLALAIIAVMPFAVEYFTRNPLVTIGGTGVLIVVSGSIEMLRQIESKALMSTYDDPSVGAGLLRRRR